MLVDGWKNKCSNKKLLVFSLKNIRVDQVYLTYHNNSKETEHGEVLAKRIVEAVKVAKSDYNADVNAIKNDDDTKIKCGARTASEMLVAENFNQRGLIQSTCYRHSGNWLIKK